MYSISLTCKRPCLGHRPSISVWHSTSDRRRLETPLLVQWTGELAQLSEQLRIAAATPRSMRRLDGRSWAHDAAAVDLPLEAGVPGVAGHVDSSERGEESQLQWAAR